MAYSAWFKSVMIQPPRVLGVRLNALSLIHTMLLEQFESPYLFKHREPRREDTLLAVFICSRTWSELQRDLFADFRTQRLLALNMRTIFRSIETAQKQLAVYFADYLDHPGHAGGKGGGMKAPIQFHAVRILCAEYGMSEVEAWDTSAIRAYCYLSASAESKGDDAVLGEYDETLSGLVNQLNDAEARGDQKDIDRLNREIGVLTRPYK